MLLKTSLSGGILIMLVIILRFLLTGKLPKRTFSLLWDIALLRLLIPFDLPLKYGISVPAINTTSPASDIQNSIIKLHDVTRNSAIPQAVNNTNNIKIPVLIWIIVMITLFMTFTLLYLKEYRKIQEALPVPKDQANYLRQLANIPAKTGLLVSDRIYTPLTFGVLHPKIVFPKFFKTEKSIYLKYIITHELVHIKRADNLRKIILLSAVCIHWFNPLVWIMYILFNHDMELSCDEKVLSVFGSNAKRDYALALINFAENQYESGFFSNEFGKKPVQERIEAIMKYKKATISSVVCAAIILGTAVTVFAKGEPGSKNNATIQNNTNAASYENTESPDNLHGFVDKEDFKEYEKYGLSYNEESGHIMYNGKVVGYFHDQKEKNTYTHITDETGKTGIRVIRNHNNEITGIKEVEIPENSPVTEINSNGSSIDNIKKYDSDTSYYFTINDVTSIESKKNSVNNTDIDYASSENGEDDSQTLEKFKKYGITYNKSLNVWQYKEKNIAGLIANTLDNFHFDSKSGTYTGTAGTEIYLNESNIKDAIYLVIDKDSLKEITEEEFDKMLEQ
ncbi:MAG: hypothetical protein HFH68_02600 [Lachnospiraceae bacterium]|nr:hypothetical protein [Lachnospiraceae bacterium]